ncbi:MAG TPA: alpha/beta fold hydrolase [Nitrososphaerales archaeon]|nr:alpha/beta fold hydrolase [Nitrososphaerales archaeon]
MPIDVTRLRSEYAGPHELVSTSDGKTLFVRRWNAGREARVSVLIFHGITGYSGPYGPMVAEQLAASGYDVFGLDLRGHGLSDGRRGDYPSEERLRRDIAETLALVKSKSDRLVVMGHSLGALPAIIATKNHPEEVSGLVIASAAKKVRTGVYPRPSKGAMLRTLIGVAILRGTPLIEYRREGQIGIDDPLFDFEYSARFYTVLYGTGALRVMRMLGSGMIDSPNLNFGGRLKVPLFVAVGEQDELFSAEGVREFCDGIDCDDKEFHVIPGARHAVWPKGAFTPLVDWLGKKF